MPFTILSGQDNSRSGVDPNVSYAAKAQEISECFNPSAFTENALGTFGNAPRNGLRNPDVFNLDAALQRSFPVADKMGLKFRIEGFNATNHVNFGQPGTNVSAPSTSGKITSASDPRILQLAAPLVF